MRKASLLETKRTNSPWKIITFWN